VGSAQAARRTRVADRPRRACCVGAARASRRARPEAGDRGTGESAGSRPPAELETLAAKLEQHPQAKTPQKLLALDLRARARPAERAALVEQAISQWRDSDPPSLLAWLPG
jgi:hypothetical protein